MNILYKTKLFIYGLHESLLLKHRYRVCEKIFKERIKKLGVNRLSGKEQQSVKVFWKKYFNISLNGHTFYKSATGLFDVKYIPDSLHYAYIDYHFNNWDMAKYMDNKCLYRTMFPGVKQPMLLAYRINGFWFNGLGGGLQMKKLSKLLKILTHHALLSKL